MPHDARAHRRGESRRGHHPDGAAAPPAATRSTRACSSSRPRVYGPLFTAGLHFWQLGESHYWGHNAIIRVAPFIRHCALGRLPGSGALSGEILSHDFVEAALMRRAGWGVWIAYDLPGSYEEMPPNLIDELKRDRRWCQGNLMNFRLVLMKGLHPAHRAVFMTGVMAYLSAPLWFLFLVLSTALLAVHTLSTPQYFVEPYQLFPLWPEWRPEWALRLARRDGARCCSCPRSSRVLLISGRAARSFGGRAAIWCERVAARCCSPRCSRRFACCSTRASSCSRCRACGCTGARRRATTPRRRGAQALRQHGAADADRRGVGGASSTGSTPAFCGGCCRWRAR